MAQKIYKADVGSPGGSSHSMMVTYAKMAKRAGVEIQINSGKTLTVSTYQAGKGKIDFEAITQWLVDEDFEGWILCEDEADQAIEDPDGVTLHDGKYCQERVLPIIS